MKIERDRAEIISGVRHGLTLGSPLALTIENKDWANWTEVMSAEPADAAGEVAPREAPAPRTRRPRGRAEVRRARFAKRLGARLGARDGGARRLRRAGKTTARGLRCRNPAATSYNSAASPSRLWNSSWDTIAAIPDEAPLRCADAEAQARMVELVDEKRREGDTLGGIFEVVARGLVPGLGSHTAWDLKLDGRLAQAVMSIPAVKAVAIGAGAEARGLPGSEVHDEICLRRREPPVHTPDQPRGRTRRRHHQRRRVARARPSQTHLDLAPRSALG